MFSRGIAPMTGKSVLGVFPVQFLHDAVSGHLGQDTGGRYAEADSIATNQGRLLHRQPLDRQAIDEGMGWRMSDFMKRK